MKNIVLLLFVLLLGLNVNAQRRRDRMGNPIVQRQPSEKDIKDHKRKMEERKEEFVANFLTTLEADDFQKEIIKQNLDTYFDAKMAVLKIKYEKNFDREQAVKKLDDTHFAELEELISEGDMKKIKEMIQGDFDEKEVKKEKKKKKKRRKDKG